VLSRPFAQPVPLERYKNTIISTHNAPRWGAVYGTQIVMIVMIKNDFMGVIRSAALHDCATVVGAIINNSEQM